MFMLLLLLGFQLFLNTSASVTSLNCPQPQQCTDTSLVAICEVSNSVLKWLKNSNQIAIYTFHSTVGDTSYSGNIKTILDQRNPTRSTLTITLDASIQQDFSIECVDNYDGDKQSCSIEFIKYPSSPTNLLAKNISESSVALEWMPPSLTGGFIDYYIVNVSSPNGTEYICPSTACNVTANGTLLPELQADVQYTVTVSAYNCVGGGTPSQSLQVTPGISHITVTGLMFDAVNLSTVNLSWQVVNNSTETVQSFLVNVYETYNMSQLTLFTVTNKSVTVTNLTKGIMYSFTVQAKDSLGRLNIPSELTNFVLDVPSEVVVLNSSIVLLPSSPEDHSYYKYFFATLHILVQYPVDQTRPPIIGYLVQHNATSSGNDTLLQFNTTEHMLPLTIGVPNTCSGSNLTLSVAALNVLGTGEWVTLNIEADFSSVSSTSSMKSTVAIGLLSTQVDEMSQIPLSSKRSTESVTATISNDIVSTTSSPGTTFTAMTTSPDAVSVNRAAVDLHLIIITVASGSGLLLVLLVLMLICITVLLIRNRRKKQKVSKDVSEFYTVANASYASVGETPSNNSAATQLHMFDNSCYASAGARSWQQQEEMTASTLSGLNTMSEGIYASIPKL